jgi:hypothetical protein
MRTHIAIISTTILALTTLSAYAQKTPAVETAQRISGTWTINRDLSPAFKPSGRSGGRAGGVAYAIGGLAAQRGGRSNPASGPTPSAPGDLTPTERAELDAMQHIEQIAPTITITATAERFSVVDPRGEQTCAIDGRTAKLTMFGATISTKCHWNKQAVQQEFSTTRTKLTRTWSLDESGHLVVKTRTEGLGERAVEAAAVYDRSPHPGSEERRPSDGANERRE